MRDRSQVVGSSWSVSQIPTVMINNSPVPFSGIGLILLITKRQKYQDNKSQKIGHYFTGSLISC